MSGWEIAVSLTSALAWPLTVLVVAVLYRHAISNLLGAGVSKMRLGPLSVEWDRLTDELERDLPPDLRSSGRSQHSRWTLDLDRFAEESPRGAILRAYEAVEEALVRKLSSHGIDTTQPLPSALEEAERQAILGPTTLHAVRGLQVLRNLAVHAPHDKFVTPERAIEFIAIAEAVLYALEGNESMRTGHGANT